VEIDEIVIVLDGAGGGDAREQDVDSIVCRNFLSVSM
jgi:hypothetical protein